MLSYRHAFHAGNFADLLKHLTLVDVLNYFAGKDKPFDYIDTHAGAGLYTLDSRDALQTGEFREGIGQWLTAGDAPAQMADYLALVRTFGRNHYPGSPALAAALLRPQDRGWLFELHPQDFRQLEKQFAGQRRWKVQQSDGFAGLQALLPTHSRRAVVLIDPPYEIKSDYRQVVESAQKALTRMANTCLLIWYPVVQRAAINTLEQQWLATGIPRIQQFELGVCADNDNYGMTAAGLFVINPPWTLFNRLNTLLPALAQRMSRDGSPHWRCQVLRGE